jgi:hypothetical protein
MDEEPKHKKKATKKKFKIVFSRIDPPVFNDSNKFSIEKLLSKPFSRKYSTLKAAEQALESWERGRGTLSFVVNPEKWTARIEKP